MLLRAGLAALVARQRGGAAADFSPQWHGVEAGEGRYAPKVPLWVIAGGLALIGLIIFAALLFRLSTESGAAIEALDQVVGSTTRPAAAPAPETATPTFEKIREILAPDITSGRLDVIREGNDIVIRLVNQGLFESGAAEPSGAWSDTFGRLAQAANLTKGPMKIEGHTDSQQIRSLAYPSNLELSQARAQAVAGAIGGAGLTDRARLSTAGYGDAQPIADNGTPDGRRQNRRVEIRVANDVAWR
jgi:type VI secretion system protein ImpK